jgi:hypothetical protein
VARLHPSVERPGYCTRVLSSQVNSEAKGVHSFRFTCTACNPFSPTHSPFLLWVPLIIPTELLGLGWTWCACTVYFPLFSPMASHSSSPLKLTFPGEPTIGSEPSDARTSTTTTTVTRTTWLLSHSCVYVNDSVINKSIASRLDHMHPWSWDTCHLSCKVTLLKGLLEIRWEHILAVQLRKKRSWDQA